MVEAVTAAAAAATVAVLPLPMQWFSCSDDIPDTKDITTSTAAVTAPATTIHRNDRLFFI